MQEQEKIETWGVLELMGHGKIAGMISTMVIGGATLIKVDVPETETIPAFTRMFNPSAMYALNPTTEVYARRVAESLKSTPIIPYDVEQQVRRTVQFELNKQNQLAATTVPAKPDPDDKEDWLNDRNY
ncbi:hypothetical protein [Xanthocytophaga agilis]|uniref:Uncharacterized protein n=1 Tax=Xanthocytophaga agilis TaxID=3048010 RepID=A0AAE3QZS1_9BACT|nr:hypothetical protein [Xanthocytophaga agilis]MDJ1500495.1 hypothetical protein [Xanthocytophaga agilis]